MTQTYLYVSLCHLMIEREIRDSLKGEILLLVSRYPFWKNRGAKAPLPPPPNGSIVPEISIYALLTKREVKMPGYKFFFAFLSGPRRSRGS